MKSDKICVLLSKFSKEELKSFEKLIISPYFGHRRNLTGYLGLLKKYHPDFDITHEEFFGKLYPGAVFNERKLKNLAAELVKLADEFLVHNYIRLNEEESEKFLSIQYKDKKLEKLFLKKQSELSLKAEGKLFNSFDCFNDIEGHEKLLSAYYVEHNKFDKYVKAWSDYTGHFTVSFIVRYLRAYTDNIVLKMGYGLSVDDPVFNLFIECMDFEKLIKLTESKNYGNIWLIRVYYYGYLAFSDLKDNSYYELYRDEFYRNINRFSRLEKHFLFSSLTDIHLMKRSYIRNLPQKEIFEIHKRMIEEEAYSPAKDEFMDIVLYRNILLLSLELRELEWVDYFVRTYTEKLSPKFRESSGNFANAWLYFEKGEFEKALRFINKVNFDFYMYKVDVRLLMLGIYYELELYDQAFSLVDSFKHFAAEGPEVKKQARRRDIKFYLILLKAKTSGDLSDVDLMIDELNIDSKHVFKNWILRKAEELIKKGTRK